MSNIHGIHQNRSSAPKGPYNPYYNEGFAPVDGAASSDGIQFDATKAKIKTLMKYALWTFSFWILVIQALTFIASYSVFYGTENEGWACVLLAFGAKFEPKIKYHYEIYRLVAPIVLHGSFLHFFSNLITQIYFNFSLESYYGKRKFIMVFFLSGIGGNLMSCLMFPEGISVGASSSLFGSFALFIFYLKENYNQMGENKNYNILVFFLLLIANIGVTADANTTVDIGAHFGLKINLVKEII